MRWEQLYHAGQEAVDGTLQKGARLWRSVVGVSTQP